MEFKDIKQWSVSKGVATPVNPYPNPYVPNSMCRDCADENGTCPNRNGAFCDPDEAKEQYNGFEFEKDQHTYATNAPDVVWDADELQLQIQNPMDGTWQDSTDVSRFYSTRLVFYPQPVEEKESEKTNLNINMENQETKLDYAIKVIEEHIYDLDTKILGTKTEEDFNRIYFTRQLLIDMLKKIKL